MPVTLQPPELKQAPQELPVKKRSWLSYAVLWAMILFVGLNVLLWNLDKDFKKKNDLWNGTGSIDLAVDAFRQLKKPPTVTLIGSSLMMYPIWTMDKMALGQIEDIFHHHNSYATEQALKQNGFADPTVFSFAIFGEMVSDAYIFVDEFLKGDRKPEILVYGLAPRDFSDCDLPTPMVTNTFKRLVTLSNFPRYANLYLPGLTDKVDFIMSHAVYFYEKRWRLQQEAQKGLDKAYTFTGVKAPQAQAAAGSTQAGFMLYGNKEERWASSIAEYKRRYRNVGERDRSVQIGFLKRLLATCHERGIKVIVVNMPLSPDNRNLLPPGFYQQFRQDIAQLVVGPDVRFLDLGESPEFTKGDYWDTAHLEHGGGYKVLQHLMPLAKELHEQSGSK